MVYQAMWKNGVTAKTSADVAAKVMDELATHGMLSAQGLVDASRPEDAPMHKDFEWNNEIAGEQWRKQQARVYIGGIIYTPTQSQGEPTRMFVKLKTDGEQYTTLETVLRSQDSMNELREQAAKELAQFRNKYNTILKMAGAIADVDALQMKLTIPIPDAKPAKLATAQ